MRTIALALGELCERVVFVGGSVCPLLISDPAAFEIRATKDVDVILDESRRSGYYQFEAELREKKFQIAAPPICRWEINGVIVDVMTTNQSAGGFSSRWYPLAFETAETIDLGDSVSIRHITAPLFIATKLDAFNDRGDGYFHHDMEDIICVVDRRNELLEEIQQADPSVRNYLAKEFQSLIMDPDFISMVPGHIEGQFKHERAKIVIERLQQIVGLGSVE